MKIVFLLFAVLLGCYGQQVSTPTPTPITTSQIEKEDPTKATNIPSPIRAMPFTSYSPSSQGQASQTETARIPSQSTQGPGYSTRPLSSIGQQGRSYGPQGRGPLPGPEARALPQGQGTQPADESRITSQPGAGPNARENENGFDRRSPLSPQYDPASRTSPGLRTQSPGAPNDDRAGRQAFGYGGSQPGEGRSAVPYGRPGYETPGTEGRTQLPGTRNTEAGLGQGGPSVTGRIPGAGYQRPALRQDVPGRQQPSAARSIPGDARGSPAAEAQPRDTGRPLDSGVPSTQGRRMGYDGPWTSYRRTGMNGDAQGVLYRGPEDHEHKPFSFNYISESDEGVHSHQQSADESGRVVGSYALALEDGRRRVVEYIADENGFRASIDTNEPGTSYAENPADVVFYYPASGAGGRRPGFQGLYYPDQTPRQTVGGRESPAAEPGVQEYPAYRRPGPQPAARTPASSQDRTSPIPSRPSSVDNSGSAGFGTPFLPATRRLQDPQESTNPEGRQQPPAVVAPAERSYPGPQISSVLNRPLNYGEDAPVPEFGSLQAQSAPNRYYDDNRFWFRRY